MFTSVKIKASGHGSDNPGADFKKGNNKSSCGRGNSKEWMYKINVNTYHNAILIDDFSNINQSSVTKLPPIVVGIKAGKELIGYIIRLQINR